MGDYVRSKGQEGLYALGRLRQQGYLGFGGDGLGLDVPTNVDPTAAGKALAEMLQSGKTVASTYYNQAVDYYKKLTASGGSKSDAEIAQYFFLQGADVLTRGVGIAASAGVLDAGTAKSITDATNAARTAIKSGFSLFSGSGGALDKIKDADALLQSMLSFAEATGANEEFVSIAKTWATTATSCATMIAASGPAPYLGAVGCAVQIALNALSLTAPKPLAVPPGKPEAVLVLGDGTSDQTKCVIRDAQLLAQVLNYHYGLESTQPLADALALQGANQNQFAVPCERDVGGCTESQLWGNTVARFRKYQTTVATAGVPAVDLTAMLLAVSALDRAVSASDWYPMMMNAVTGVLTHAVCKLDYDAVCEQVNPDKLWAKYYIGEMNQIGIAIGASFGRGLVATNQAPREWLPFIRVDELINYFVAVSYTERRQDRNAWADNIKRFLGGFAQGIPVRLYGVPTEGNGYSKTCWTRLNIMHMPLQGESPTEASAKCYMDGACGDGCANALMQKLTGGGDYNSLAWMEIEREYATLRLMAAMSYLIYLHKNDSWQTYGRGTLDLIRGLPHPAVGSVAWNAQMPCDPRQIVLTSSNTWQANKYGDQVGPWDPSSGFGTIGSPMAGATIKQVEGRWVAGIPYNSTTPRTQTTRNGAYLAYWIAQREAYFAPIIASALRAADAATSGVAMVVAPSTAMVAPGTFTKPLSPIATSMFRPSDAFLAQIKTTAQWQSECEANGGYIADDGLCHPTPATEDACRATGGTPYWDPNVKYRCLAPGEVPPTSAPVVQASSGGGGVLLLGAAALLLMKYMK